MRTIKLDKNDFVENFKILGAIPNKLHEDLVKKGKIVRIDDFNDIEINLDGEKYWVTTCAFISRENRNSVYRIDIEYEIHKNSKYNESIYSFVR